MPVYYDLNVFRGNTFSIELNTLGDDGVLPLNLSGYAVSGHIRYTYGSTGLLADLGVTIKEPLESGVLRCSIPSNITATLPITQAVYDIEMYNISGLHGSTSGEISKVLDGRVNIHPEVTRGNFETPFPNNLPQGPIYEG
jgi:hypothetical protein